MSIIHGGMAIRDFDMAPAFERSKHHEEVGGTVALVLVIETGRASRFHRDRHARFGNQLLARLVKAHQWAIGIACPQLRVDRMRASPQERSRTRRTRRSYQPE